MTSDMRPSRFIGCDVGKANIVVFDDTTGQTRTIPNRPKDLAAFAAQLDASCLVICEATGGYEAALLDALIMAKRQAHRADARKVKAFIRSFGTLGKTDEIDARALSQYGKEREPRLARWQTPDPAGQNLQALVLARQDLVAERVAYRNRLAAPGANPIAPYLKKVLACLDEQIKAIELAAAKLVRTDPWLRQAIDTLTTIVGIGQLTATSMIALMPELGSLNRRQAAALAGLAPHPDKSGSADRYRRTRGGRPGFKAIIFLPALTAARHNPTLAAFYDRLRQNGKKSIVANTAVMRKLVIICNAKLAKLRFLMAQAGGERPVVA